MSFLTLRLAERRGRASAPRGVAGRRARRGLRPTTKLDAGKDAFAAYGKGGVTVIAGNNLFKFAPVLGQLLAQSAISGRIIEPPTVASGGVTAESL